MLPFRKLRLGGQINIVRARAVSSADPSICAGGSRALRGRCRGKEQKIRTSWDFAA